MNKLRRKRPPASSASRMPTPDRLASYSVPGGRGVRLANVVPPPMRPGGASRIGSRL